MINSLRVRITVVPSSSATDRRDGSSVVRLGVNGASASWTALCSSSSMEAVGLVIFFLLIEHVPSYTCYSTQTLGKESRKAGDFRARRPLRLFNSETIVPCDRAVCVEAYDNDSGHGYAFLKTLFEFAISRSLENGPL